MEEYIFDIAVVGAGTAGSAAAKMLASQGWRVVLLDALDQDSFSQHITDVPPWMFHRAGVSMPCEKELHCNWLPLSFTGKDEEPVLHFDHRPQWGIRTELFIKRLQAEAVHAGVEIWYQTSLKEVLIERERVTGLVVDIKSKNSIRSCIIKTLLTIDASGYAQAVLRKVPHLSALCPPPLADERCNAAQHVYEIKDIQGAEEFLSRHKVRSKEIWCKSAYMGPYSSYMVSVDLEEQQVDLLFGYAQAPYVIDPEVQMKLWLQKNPWVGAHKFGGQRLIPIRKPYEILVAQGIALIGDAGCMAFPVHGSGVGCGLVAARILAHHLAHVTDPGAISALWEYNAAFQHEFGSIHAAYDILRKFYFELTEYDIQQLLRLGFMNPQNIYWSLDQKIPPIDGDQVIQVIRATVNNPALAVMLGNVVLRMQAVYKTYAMYPKKYKLSSLKRWSVLVALAGGTNQEIS